jgi:hypothetical protein
VVHQRTDWAGPQRTLPSPRRIAAQCAYACQKIRRTRRQSLIARMQGAPASPNLATMRNEGHPLIDRSHRGCARGRRDYEQRLQEQPSHVVRSDVQRTAPRANWVEVTSHRFPAVIRRRNGRLLRRLRQRRTEIGLRLFRGGIRTTQRGKAADKGRG